jgi:enoyl-CoA hydratase
MSYTTILVEKKLEDKVGIITLNRPEVRNAIDQTMREEVAQALSAFEQDAEVRAIILTGGPKVFAAGADIAAMVEKTALEQFYRLSLVELTFQMEKTAKPIIAAIAGFALGGGCELAMACDMIVAAEDASFGQPEIRIGVMPGAGGTQRLTRAIGKARAMEIILTGRTMSAAEAEAHGLVTSVVPAAATVDAALELGARIASMPPLAVRAAKDAIRAADETSLRDGLAREREAFFRLFDTEDQAEGMAAFTQKRAPTWSGR